MTVEKIIPGCGGVATVLLTDGRALTTSKSRIKESGLLQGARLNIYMDGKITAVMYGGVLLVSESH